MPRYIWFLFFVLRKPLNFNAVYTYNLKVQKILFSKCQTLTNVRCLRAYMRGDSHVSAARFVVVSYYIVHTAYENGIQYSIRCNTYRKNDNK